MPRKKFSFRSKKTQMFELTKMPREGLFKIFDRLEKLHIIIDDEYDFWIQIFPKSSEIIRSIIRTGNKYEELKGNIIFEISKRFEYEELVTMGLSRHIKRPQYLKYQRRHNLNE